MKQALHIFRKDVRYLWREISLVLLLSVGYALGGATGWPADILMAAGLYLVVRLIHAEAIPGDRQFWLTRPYRPASLFGAKMLFIFAFICVPIGVAQMTLAMILGFPLGQEIPGLLWTQVLILIGCVLPVVALAAVTTGIVPFLMAVLTMAAIAWWGGSALPTMFPARFPAIPHQVDWMGGMAFGAVVGGISAIVLVWQYRGRRTLLSRLFGVIAYYLAMALYLPLPPALPLKVETWLSNEPRLASGVQVSVDLSRRRTASTPATGRDVQVLVPVIISGLPEGIEAVPDFLSLSFEWPGQKWSPALKMGVNPNSLDKGRAVFETNLRMDPSLFRVKREQPLTIHGTVYLTLFGEPERRKISARNGPVNVQDGLQCYSGDIAGGSGYMLCRSLFRWPARLVRAEVAGNEDDFGNWIVSYSPFPAVLDFNPLDVRFAEPMKAEEVTIVTKKPLVHLERDFELSGIRLADFEKAVPVWFPYDNK